MDYKDKTVIIRDFLTAQKSYRDYQKNMDGGNEEKAQEALNVAGEFIYQCYELALKHYLFQQYKELAKKGTLSWRKWKEKEKLLDTKKANRLYLYKEMSQYADPTIKNSKIDFLTIKEKSSSVSNKKKHAGNQVTAEDFCKVYPEIRKLVLTYVDSNAKINETGLDFSMYHKLTAACNDWNKNGHWGYALITDNIADLTLNEMEILTNIPWSVVFDFYADSERSGLCSTYFSTHHRVPERFKISHPEKTEFDPMTQSPYWYFLGGVSDDTSSLIHSPREWRQKKLMYLSHSLKRYREVFSRPLHVLIMDGPPDRLADLIHELDAVYEENAKFYLLSSETRYERMVEDLKRDGVFVESCPISGSLFALGIQEYTSLIPEKKQLGAYHIVGVQGKVSIEPASYTHLDIPCLETYQEQKDNPQANDPIEFYQGKQRLSWYGAKSGFALRRIAPARELCTRILRLKDEVSSKILQLRHKPGAGGTTLSVQVAQEISDKMPVAYMLFYKETDTCSQIERLYHHTQISILLIADESSVTIEQIRKFSGEMRAKTIPHIILFVARQQKHQKDYEERDTTTLLNLLSNDEINDLGERLTPYGLEADKIENVKIRPHERYPFYMALYTFEDRFQGIKDYVRHFWDSMSENETKIISFIALADIYSHQAIDENFFPHKKIEENESGLFDDPIHENLIAMQTEAGTRRCHIRHALFAQEILQLSLGHSQETEYAARLSTLLCDLITYSRQNSSYVSYESTINMLKNLLIFRDMSSVGREDRFSDVIMEIKKNLPRGDDGACIGVVFKTLEDLYPEEAHFVAHLSRFYTNIERNYIEGVKKAKQAVSVAEEQNQNDPILYHIAGTSIKNKLKYFDYPKLSRITDEELTDALQEIQQELEAAGEFFQRVRNSTNKKSAGYLSHIEMCIEFLDAMKQKHGINSTEEFASNYKDSWMISYYNIAVDLLQGYKDLPMDEDDEFYRLRMQDKENFFSKADELLASLEQTINMWEGYLEKADASYRPMVRKFIAYAKRERMYRDGTENQSGIKDILDLMEQNLQETPQDESSLSLWFYALRQYRGEKQEILLDKALVKLALWKQLGGSIVAYYYYYVLTCLKAIDGSSRAEAEIPSLIQEIRARTARMPNNNNVLEWLGQGQGLSRLIPAYKYDHGHRRRIGMEEIVPRLELLQGRIHQYKRARNAQIRAYNMDVFFVPINQEKKYQVTQGDESKLVVFSCGFSYSGVRAYDKSVRLQQMGSFKKESGNEPRLGRYERVRILSWDSPDHIYLNVSLENYENLLGRIYRDDIPWDVNDPKLLDGREIYAYIEEKKNSEQSGRTYWKLSLQKPEMTPLGEELKKWQEARKV